MNAVEAARAGDLPACLEALLERWRARRLGELGAAIDRVSDILNDGRQPPDDFRDGTLSDIEARLEDMLARPADPRIGSAMLRAAIDLPFSHPGGGTPELVELLVRNADERFRSETGGDRENWKWAQRLEASLAGLTPIDEERRELAALNAALDDHIARAPMTERKLLERILAAPDDDTPRLVYADWLSERGHPRGELIVLECGAETPATLARIAELKRLHTRALLGPAAHIVSRFLRAFDGGGAKTTRGLLTSMRVERDGPAWWLDSPLFWFIEDLVVFSNAERSALHVIQSAKTLRSVSVGVRLFAQLCALNQPLAIPKVRLVHYGEFDPSLGSMLDRFAGSGLTGVRRFELFFSDEEERVPEGLFVLPFMTTVEELAVSCEDLEHVRAQVNAFAPHIRKVSALAPLGVPQPPP